MRTEPGIATVLLLAAAALLGCQDQRIAGPEAPAGPAVSAAAMAEPEPPCRTSVMVPLRTADGAQLGQAVMWNGPTTAYVRVTAPPGVQFVELRVAGVRDVEDFPRTPDGAIDPARFPIGGVEDPPIPSALAQAVYVGNPYGIQPHIEVKIAVFARALLADGGPPVALWAHGYPIDPGEHPMYFEYELRSCAVFTSRIVLNNDEWTLSEAGFAAAGADAGRFALNVADFFTGGEPGRFLVFSTNFGLTGRSLGETLTAAGHTVVVSTEIPFTLATLREFDAIFLAGPAPVVAWVLEYYIGSGGGLYLAAGTGSFGSAAAEAEFWNPVLSTFGLALAPAFNGVSGVVPIGVEQRLFAGVRGLYQNGGNSVIDLEPGEPRGRVILTARGEGLIAVFEEEVQEEGRLP